MDHDLDVDLASLNVDTFSAGGRYGPFQIGSALYLFPRDSTDATRIRALKSTDGGRTWAEKDAANRPSAVIGILYISGGVDGTDIHLSTGGQSGSPASAWRVYYHRFSTSTDTWTETNTRLDGTSALAPAVALAVRTDGNVVVFYAIKNTIKGTDYHSLAYAKRVGTTWTTNVTIAAGDSAHEYFVYDAVPGLSGRVHVFGYQSNATTSTFDDILHWCLRSAYTVSSITSIMDIGGFTTGTALSFDDGGTQKIAFAFPDSLLNNTNSFPRWAEATDADSPTFTVSGQLQTTYDSQTVKGFYYGGTRYVILDYQPPATSDHAWKVQTQVSGTWGTPTQFDSDLLLLAPQSAGIVTRTGYDDAVVYGIGQSHGAHDSPATAHYRDYILVAGAVTAIPPLRLHPRGDTLGSGASRLWPPPAARQSNGPRLHPAYW